MMKKKKKKLLRRIEEMREFLAYNGDLYDALDEFRRLFPPRALSRRVEYQIIVDNRAYAYVSDNHATAREITEGLNDVLPDGWTCLVLEDGGFSIRVRSEGEYTIGTGGTDSTVTPRKGDTVAQVATAIAEGLPDGWVAQDGVVQHVQHVRSEGE